MVAGRLGIGKAILIDGLVESLADESLVVASLASTQLTADDLLRMVAFAFGITDKSTIHWQSSARFLGRHRQGGRALLIVGGAQDLNQQAME